jgi:ATP-dependent protease ClpP protease subunit
MSQNEEPAEAANIQRRKVTAYPAVEGPRKSPRPGSAPDRAWELAICGDLTDKQSELMGRLLELPRDSRGTIFFDSCGGSAYVGLGLASLIRLRGLRADAVVTGECSSAALLPFAACPRRFVTPHSTLLFHPLRWQSEVDVRYEEAVEWARHFREMEHDLDRLLTRMFSISEEQLAAWTRPGRFVSGQEMVDAGLAQMIDLFSGSIWRQISGHRAS